jgi:hypothetical protein
MLTSDLDWRSGRRLRDWLNRHPPGSQDNRELLRFDEAELWEFVDEDVCFWAERMPEAPNLTALNDVIGSTVMNLLVELHGMRGQP